VDRLRALGEEPKRLRPLNRVGAEGRRGRPLSVLFADVCGYTKITEQLVPGEVPAFLNRLYEAASSALLTNDALLGQIEGDKVMALFVPGFAGSGYKVKAVEGARSLLAAVGRSSELKLEVGIGVASGEEFIRQRRRRRVQGLHRRRRRDEPRLTAVADAGEILIDRETYAAVDEMYPDAGRKTLDVKGKAAPVEAFAIRG
jgi:adenylate cyclase